MSAALRTSGGSSCLLTSVPKLNGYGFCLGVRVPHQHPWVSVAADGSDLRHVETLLEEPAHRFVAQIVEAQAGYAGPRVR
jgi:hypothetical protein